MIVENINTNAKSEKHEALSYAQTVSNFFIDAIDQNDCNVKVVLGFYQELKDTVNSIEDLNTAFKKPRPDSYRPGAGVSPEDSLYKDPTEIIDKPLESDFITKAATEAMKNKCYDCKLEIPKINFSNDLDFLHNKLNLQLDVFKNTFLTPFKGNYCHLAYSMQYTCIPDLVKMIGMIMTAYAAVLALNKLPSFSLNAFIKGIVGKLIAAVVGSLTVSLDASSTGLPCLISVVEELATSIPTNETLAQSLNDDQKANSWVSGYQTIDEYEARLDEELSKNWITEEEHRSLLETYKRNNDPVNFYTNKVEEELGSAEDSISGIFQQVNEVIDSAQNDINAYIQAILGVVNFFECESKRSGSDFTEITEYINNMTTVINIFSALIAILVPKTMHWNLCKDEMTVEELKNTLESPVEEPLTVTEIEELVKEFTQKESVISEDGLSVVIYDKPYTPRLPKLELMGCNFKEFAEAHSLDNIVKNSVDSFLSNTKKDSELVREYKEDVLGYPTINNSFEEIDKVLPNLLDPIISDGKGLISNKNLRDYIEDRSKGYVDRFLKKPSVSGSIITNKNYTDEDLLSIPENQLDRLVNDLIFPPREEFYSDTKIEGVPKASEKDSAFSYSKRVDKSPSNRTLTGSILQNSKDYVFGKVIVNTSTGDIVKKSSQNTSGSLYSKDNPNAVDFSNIFDNISPRIIKSNIKSLEDTLGVEYKEIGRVNIDFQDIFNELDFDKTLTDLMDFIYEPKEVETGVDSVSKNLSSIKVNSNDYKPAFEYGQDTSYTPSQQEESEAQLKEDLELSIYKNSSESPSDFSAECRSVEDVMNTLKQLKF